MSLISLEKAANRLGLLPEEIEEWARQGLLKVQNVVKSSNLPPGLPGFIESERMVEEEELGQVVESLGWLQLSGEDWDDGEGE